MLRNVTLEMSLKPFGNPAEAVVRETVRRLFRQWEPLCRHADMVSVMLWTADGSEILDYQGHLDAPFEWAYWVGGANPRSKHAGDPERLGLHSRPYKYMDNPPTLTYGWLKDLVQIIKEEGQALLRRPVRVGETFDPGPEFAISPFKYERHNEVCASGTMGQTSFIVCYTTLKGDDRPYAGFPRGIPDGTPFGAFFGRQCRHFLGDLGFDFIWFSNGFGFGSETWSLRGAIFDGKEFHTDRLAEVHQRNLEFWRLFRAECPDIPVETRGTNLGTGMDLSSDGVPLREIYRGGFGLEPPPNSPWAALNGDFGLELTGWMSHIAELPGETFPFRFYTHDPWWNNSPWLDRYGRSPHDIQLPLAVARLTATGEVHHPTTINFLTVDNSWGELPDIVPREVIPHILDCLETAPDAPGPLVWVYPFDEYHEWAFAQNRAPEVFFGDWLMRGAVDQGFPLNTVISTRNAARALREAPEKFARSILVSPIPDAGSEWDDRLWEWLTTGGQVLLYGPTHHAAAHWTDLLGLDRAEALEGEFDLQLWLPGDFAPTTAKLRHPGVFNAGGLAEIPRPSVAVETLALVQQGDQTRAVAVAAEGPGGGRLVWLRGTVAADPAKVGGHLLVPYPERVSFPGERLFRLALSAFGYDLLIEPLVAEPAKRLESSYLPPQRAPIMTIARQANGDWFAGYTPVQTVRQHFRCPQGAPLLNNQDAILRDGRASYVLPKSWRHECRVYVEQGDGEIGCRERPYSEQFAARRCLHVAGLRNGTVRFYPVPGTERRLRLLLNPVWPYIGPTHPAVEERRDRWGHYFELRRATGDLLIIWEGRDA